MIRELNEWEVRVLENLIGELLKSSGRATPTLAAVRAEPYEDGLSVGLIVDDGFQVGSSMTVPVEGEGTDASGGVVSILLHCRAGTPVELEIFRGDGVEVDGYPALDGVKYFVNDSKMMG